MRGTIPLSDVLTEMRRVDRRGRKKSFSIRFVTYDKNRRNKPSRHVHIKKAEECGAAHSLLRHHQVGIKPLSGEMDHQVAVHIRLITEFNGMLVL